MRLGLALAIHVAAAIVVPVAAAERAGVPPARTGALDASSARSGFAPALPLRRDADDAVVGPRSAALAAAGVLLLAGWVAVQYRRRQRGVPRKAGGPGWPWLGHLLPDAQERQLRVVETASLTSHASVHVVAWKGREYLVATGPDHVRVLDRREMPVEQAQGPASEAP
jgi:hypothetical protein